MKKVEVIEVHWKDATGESGWVTEASVKGKSLADILTIGILIEETDAHYLIAGCQDQYNDNVDNYIWVPKSCVVKVVRRKSKIGK